MSTGLENLAWMLAARGYAVYVLALGESPDIKQEISYNKVSYYFGGNKKPTPIDTKKLYTQNFQSFMGSNDIVIGWIINLAPIMDLYNQSTKTEMPRFIANQGAVAPNLLLKNFVRKYGIIKGINIYRIVKRTRDSFESVVCISQAVAKSIKSSYGVPEEVLKVIPRGVDIDRFKFVSSEERKEKTDRLDILYTGNISREKGIIDLLEALSRIQGRRLRLHLVGILFEDVKKEIYRLCNAGMEHEVLTPGVENVEQLICRYQSCDFFVFPSHREGLGKSLIEAMACGIPVLASNIPAFNEVGRDGYEIVFFDCQNVNDLKNKLEMLIEDPTLRKVLPLNARRKIEQKFSSRYELASWMELLG